MLYYAYVRALGDILMVKLWAHGVRCACLDYAAAAVVGDVAVTVLHARHYTYKYCQRAWCAKLRLTGVLLGTNTQTLPS